MSASRDSGVVYVVDDDDAMRDSLRWLLRSAGYTVFAFASAAEFLRADRAEVRSCLLLDVRMPGLSGLELQQELNRAADTLPVIFLTGHGDIPMAVNAVKRGAFHFLEKPVDDAELLEVIDEALATHGGDAEQQAVRRAKALIATLTQREREVMELVALGRKNKQIAAELSVSVKTVEAHRAKVMEKTGAHSSAELAGLVFAAKRLK
jgi:FixJ family two-component response regulator